MKNRKPKDLPKICAELGGSLGKVCHLVSEYESLEDICSALERHKNNVDQCINDVNQMIKYKELRKQEICNDKEGEQLYP